MEERGDLRRSKEYKNQKQNQNIQHHPSQESQTKKQTFVYQQQIAANHQSNIQQTPEKKVSDSIQSFQNVGTSNSQQFQFIQGHNQIASMTTYEMTGLGLTLHSQHEVMGTLDSNGNEIRGRKIDSPHLIVMKEIREIDEDDYQKQHHPFILNSLHNQEDYLNQFGTGSVDDLGNYGFNSKEFKGNGQQQQFCQNDSIKRMKRPFATGYTGGKQMKSKSLESKKKVNNNNARQSLGGSRPSKGNIQQNQQQDFMNRKAMATLDGRERDSQKKITRGTKSQRDIRTSMGFQELLNQLDKDGSTIHQSNLNNDFKNRTMHDLLQLELSGIRKQGSSSKGKIAISRVKEIKEERKSNTVSRSKSNEKTREKSKSKNKRFPAPHPKIFQYTFNPNQTPDKTINQGPNTASFLHSEHGRCVTSQGIVQQNNSLYFANGRTKSHSNLGATQQQLFQNSNSQNNITVSSNARYSKPHPQTTQNQMNYHQMQKDQSSPDRQRLDGGVKDFKPIGNIDKLIRDNLKKKNKKDVQEKLQKQKSEENFKKKKEELELKNTLVRIANKQKTYYKKQQQQTIDAQQDTDQGLVDNNDQINRMKKIWNESAQLKIKFKANLLNQKQSQTQQVDFEKLKQASKGKKFDFKNHRKSYGLEFIDIKKEIQQELRTIDEKIKTTNQPQLIMKPQNINIFEFGKRGANNENSAKRLKIKTTSKEQYIEKSNFNDNGTSERGPVEKVIIIKKSKIRKFMKAKQKEMVQQKFKEKKDEIIKAKKLQENLIKLDKFCKKKTINQPKGHPHGIVTIHPSNIIKLSKKRNATLQVQDFEGGPDMINDHKKHKINNIRGKSMKEINLNSSKQYLNEIQRVIQEDGEEDSSGKLSTEFYEEYFRLIQSIKKEQQSDDSNFIGQGSTFAQQQKPNNIRSSKDLIGGSLNDQNKLSSPVSFQIMTTQQQTSSLPQTQQPTQSSPVRETVPLQNQAVNILMNNKKTKKKSKKTHKQHDEVEAQNLKIAKPSLGSQNLTSSKKQILNTHLAERKDSKDYSQNVTINGIKNQSNEKQNQLIGSKQKKERAESAPLVKKKPKKNTVANQMSPHQKKNSKGQISLQQQQHLHYQQQIHNDSSRMSKSEQLQIFLEKIVRIQRAMRYFLSKKGFYKNFYFQQSNEFQTEFYEGDTVKKIDIDQLQNEIAQEDQEDEFEDDLENQDMLMMNQEDDTLGDDKKVVYLSNINSCSLPLTPKDQIDDTQNRIQMPHSNQDIMKLSNQQQSKSNKNGVVFDYKIFESLQSQSAVQSISQKPSVFTNDVDTIVKPRILEGLELQEESKHNSNSIHHNNHEISSQLIEDEEQMILRGAESARLSNKNDDYKMRIFTGSESMVREFKHHTPKESRLQLNFKDSTHSLMSSQTSVRGQQYAPISQPLTQQNINQNMIIDLRNMSNNIAANSNSIHDHTSQSSQSLFERNSFQQFTRSRLNQIMQNNEFSNLIDMREKALEYKQKKEGKLLKKMCKNNQLSPRTYNSKKEQLEKWVKVEKEEIQKTKTAFQQEWQKTIMMIEETQKNVDSMRIKMKITIDNNSKHHPGGLQGQTNAHAYNSQTSRNSSTSNLLLQNTIGEQKRRSILEEEPPISSRNLKQSVYNNNGNTFGIVPTAPLNQDKMGEQKLIDFLEEKRIEKLNTSGEFIETSNTKSQLQRSKNLPPQGIFIEDQKEVKDQCSETDNDDEEIKSTINLQQLKESQEEQFEQSSEAVNEDEEEKGLSRSRSEQDLQEIYRKIKSSNSIGSNRQQDLMIIDQNDQDNILNIDSFNLLQSTFKGGDLSSSLKRGEFNMLSGKLHRQQQLNEIKIQENLFQDEIMGGSDDRLVEDEEDENVSPNQHINEQIENQIKQQQMYKQVDQFMESQDSLLNEEDLNNYCQEDKFSIEDFKMLNKKQLVQPDKSSLPFKMMKYDDDDELQEDLLSSQRNQRKSEDSIVKQSHVNPTTGLQVYPQLKLNPRYHQFQDDDMPLTGTIQTEPDLYDDHFEGQLDILKQQRVQTPESHSNQPLFSHNLLFQNAKPGENIKISDILKKTSSLHGLGGSADSFLDQSSISNMMFQNPSISQVIQSTNLNIQQPYEQSTFLSNSLAEKFTDEILNILLMQCMQIPQRGQQSVDTQDVHQTDQAIIQQNQQDNQDIFVIDTVVNEREQRRELIENRQRYLMEQDLQKVELYINEVIATLLQSELQGIQNDYNSLVPNIQDIQEFHRQFLNVLTNPIKKIELDILNSLQTSEIGSYEHFETAQDMQQFPILPVDLYLEIEKQREETQLQVGIPEPLENSIIQESIHIYNKAIFDALNESLMKFRPYGIQGEPMPWSNKVRRLQTKVDASSVDTERLFQMVKQDVLRWCQNFAGCIPTPVFSFQRNENNSTINSIEPQPQSNTFDEELFQETRERRLAAMLATEVVETEHQWLNYEFEEAQVKIDLSDMILEHMVEEIVEFMNQRQSQQHLLY